MYKITTLCIMAHLLLSCGKEELRTEVIEYELGCNNIYNSLECHGSNIHCEYSNWDQHTLRCTVQTQRIEE